MVINYFHFFYNLHSGPNLNWVFKIINLLPAALFCFLLFNSSKAQIHYSQIQGAQPPWLVDRHSVSASCKWRIPIYIYFHFCLVAYQLSCFMKIFFMLFWEKKKGNQFRLIFDDLNKVYSYISFNAVLLACKLVLRVILQWWKSWILK